MAFLLVLAAYRAEAKDDIMSKGKQVAKNVEKHVKDAVKQVESK